LFNVSLDLSRACPGKPIGFMPHWRREGQVCFRTGVRGTAAARADVEHCRACPAPRLQLQTEPSVKLLQPWDLQAGAASVELCILYCEQRQLFFTFVCDCPEPVLANDTIISFTQQGA
jgi:hypothetical protein